MEPYSGAALASFLAFKHPVKIQGLLATRRMSTRMEIYLFNKKGLLVVKI